MNTGTPELSIIIATHNASQVIEACLSTLYKQKLIDKAEIIIADSSSDGTDKLISESFPDVELLHFPEPLTLPRLRGQALAKARGGIAAILDPFSVVGENWCSELLRVHAERPEFAIGGAVELYRSDERSLVDWCNYINEYGGFIPPLEEGVVDILPGSNISYKRQALPEPDSLREKGFWKAFVNWKLEAGNHPLWLAPAVTVYLNKPVSFPEFFRSRFDHGRCYATMRVADQPASTRYFRALTTPLLPLLFHWRLARSYWPKRRHRKEFILTSPLMFLLNISWAFGELRGYLSGPGQSCSKLFY